MSAALAVETDVVRRVTIESRRLRQVEEYLTTLLRLMGYSVRLEVSDLGEANLGVALHCSGDAPGLADGKRGHLLESLQLLANKRANHGESERVWVTLGVSRVPEPRRRSGPQAGGTSAPVPPRGPAPSEAKAVRQEASRAAAAGESEGSSRARGEAGRGARGGSALETARAPLPRPSAQSHHRAERREGSGEQKDVADVPETTRWALAMAEKAVRLGRPFAVLGLDADDRIRVLRATKRVPGLGVREEGELHLRRVAFVPERLVPIQRRAAMPDWDDEEE